MSEDESYLYQGKKEKVKLGQLISHVRSGMGLDGLKISKLSLTVTAHTKLCSPVTRLNHSNPPETQIIDTILSGSVGSGSFDQPYSQHKKIDIR